MKAAGTAEAIDCRRTMDGRELLSTKATAASAEGKTTAAATTANVQQTDQHSETENSAAVHDRLKLAREGLVANIALLLVEDAYSRMVAARQELAVGFHDNALALLQSLPALASEVQMSAPTSGPCLGQAVADGEAIIAWVSAFELGSAARPWRTGRS